jgi:hypothetical protein
MRLKKLVVAIVIVGIVGVFGLVSTGVQAQRRSQTESTVTAPPPANNETSEQNPCPKHGCTVDEGASTESESNTPAKPYDWRASFAEYKVGKVSRTADGKPDLQGIWSRTTLVPVQRPRGQNATIDAATATKLENAAQQKQFDLRTEPTDTPPGEKTTDAYNTFWRDGYWFKVPMTSLHTSQVVDPPNGRIPTLLPAAAAAARERERVTQVLDNGRARSYEDRPIASRCIRPLGSPGPAMTGGGPGGQESTFEIIQGNDSVIIRGENLRSQLIYLDARSRPPENVHLDLGAARGHWDGDTLIVEYTNFADAADEEGGGGREHIIARYKRLDDTHLLFGFTREDPGIRPKPYSVEVVFWRLTDQEQLVEYACHEGNVGLEFTLSAARAKDWEEAQDKSNDGK